MFFYRIPVVHDRHIYERYLRPCFPKQVLQMMYGAFLYSPSIVRPDATLFLLFPEVISIAMARQRSSDRWPDLGPRIPTLARTT